MKPLNRLLAPIVVSNVAYILVGVVAYLANSSAFAPFIGAGLVVLGVSSAVFHYGGLERYEHLLEQALYASLGMIAAYHLGLSPELAYPIVLALVMLYHIVPSRAVVPALAVLAIVGAFAGGALIAGVLSLFVLGTASYIRATELDVHGPRVHLYHYASAAGLLILSL